MRGKPQKMNGGGDYMKGWLVVNSFLHTNKFEEIYGFLKSASARRGISLDIVRSSDILCDVEDGFSAFSKPDFVLFWDKDIMLAKRLEMAGLKLFNSASAVEICDNKALTAIALSGKVRTPRTVIAPKTFEGVNYCDKKFVSEAVQILGLPIVIKEVCGSFGAQVYLAEDLSQAERIADKIGYKDFIMQQFISSSCGKDIRVNVVGGKAVCAMLRYNENDFRSNITNGGKMKRVELSAEFEDAAVAACNAIGLDFAGVDVLFGADGEPVVCEVNSNPHFKSSLECTGVDLSEYIIDYIAEKLV